MIAICRVESDGTYVELCRFEEVPSSHQVTVHDDPKQDVEQPPGFEGVPISSFNSRSEMNALFNEMMTSGRPKGITEWYRENWESGFKFATMKPKVLDLRLFVDSDPIHSKDNNIFAHLDTVPREGLQKLCKELNIHNIKAELTVYGYKYILYRVYQEGFK